MFSVSAHVLATTAATVLNKSKFMRMLCVCVLFAHMLLLTLYSCMYVSVCTCILRGMRAGG